MKTKLCIEDFAGQGGPFEEPSPAKKARRQAVAAIAEDEDGATIQGTTPTGQGADRLAPPNVLSWRSAADRNRKLRPWRRLVMNAFGEQTRALRVAWLLDGLFNVRTGYANASNTYIAKETGIAINKVQKTLAELEAGGAIVRVVIRSSHSITRRMIYPAATLVGGPPTVGVGGHPQQPGVQNLKRHSMPRSQLAYARAESAIRERRASATVEGNGFPSHSPSSQREEGSKENARSPGAGNHQSQPQSSAKQPVVFKNVNDGSEADGNASAQEEGGTP